MLAMENSEQLEEVFVKLHWNYVMDLVDRGINYLHASPE